MNRAIDTEKVREYIERAEQARGTEAWRGFLLCHEYKRRGRWSYLGWYVPFVSANPSFCIKSFPNKWNGGQRFYLYDVANDERYELRYDTDCLEFFGVRKEVQA